MLKRTWTPTPTVDAWKVWDLGNEMWELKNDTLSHIRIESRIINEDNLEEIVELLQESPIPLEAIPRMVKGWTVSEVPYKKKHKKRVKDIDEDSSLVRELWSSLSQWIPPNALYQPSLHHQAVLELSDKPIHIFVSPIKRYSRIPRGHR